MSVTVSDIPDLLRPVVPRVGSVWLWEPEHASAREFVTVTAVEWNGEEVWVQSRQDGDVGRGEYWNDLSRWVEATVLVAPPPNDSSET